MSGIEFVDIPFGPYLPDLGGAPNADVPGYLTDATGVRLTPSGYRGTPTFADVASATAVGTDPNAMQAWGVFEPAGTRAFFVFNFIDAKIYESIDDGVTWGDVTPAAGAALGNAGDVFTFETETLYVSASRAPLAKVTFSGTGTKFTDLPGSPPVAYCGAQVRQHVVLGGLVATSSSALRWCAIGDSHDWPTPGTADAAAKEAGTEELPASLGRVFKILGGEKIGIAVQSSGLTRMTYEGGDAVYAFDTYETKIGAGNGNFGFPAFATDGNIWYWKSELGFFATDGYSVNPLSEGKISDAIFNDLISHPLAAQTQYIVSAAFDLHRRSVVFGGPGGDYQLCYRPDNGSFTWMNEAAVHYLFSQVSPSSFLGKTAGNVVYNINQSNRKLQALSGSTPTVAIQTGYIEVDPGYSVQLQGAHLLGAGVPGSLAIAYKASANYAACDVSQSGFTSLTANTRGMKNTGRASSQFFSFRITGTGSEAQLVRGIRVFFTRDVPSQ